MEYTASVRSASGGHTVAVAAGGTGRTLDVPARDGLPGSAVSGGELLLLALATCFANDLYREAVPRGVAVDSVEVQATGWFDAPGSRARDVAYRVVVASTAPDAQVRELVAHVDAIAEVHGSLREGTAVALDDVTVVRPPGAEQS